MRDVWMWMSDMIRNFDFCHHHQNSSPEFVRISVQSRTSVLELELKMKTNCYTNLFYKDKIIQVKLTVVTTTTPTHCETFKHYSHKKHSRNSYSSSRMKIKKGQCILMIFCLQKNINSQSALCQVFLVHSFDWQLLAKCGPSGCYLFVCEARLCAKLLSRCRNWQKKIWTKHEQCSLNMNTHTTPNYISSWAFLRRLEWYDLYFAILLHNAAVLQSKCTALCAASVLLLNN